MTGASTGGTYDTATGAPSSAAAAGAATNSDIATSATTTNNTKRDTRPPRTSDQPGEAASSDYGPRATRDQGIHVLPVLGPFRITRPCSADPERKLSQGVTWMCAHDCCRRRSRIVHGAPARPR